MAVALRDDSRIADVTVHLAFRDALQIQVALRARVAYLAALGPSYAVSRAHAEKVLAAFDDALYPEAPEGGIEQYQSESR